MLHPPCSAQWRRSGQSTPTPAPAASTSTTHPPASPRAYHLPRPLPAFAAVAVAAVAVLVVLVVAAVAVAAGAGVEQKAVGVSLLLCLPASLPLYAILVCVLHLRHMATQALLGTHPRCPHVPLLRWWRPGLRPCDAVLTRVAAVAAPRCNVSPSSHPRHVCTHSHTTRMPPPNALDMQVGPTSRVGRGCHGGGAGGRHL